MARISTSHPENLRPAYDGTMQPVGPLVFGLVLLVIAVLLTRLTVRVCRKSIGLLRRGIRVPGVVVSLVERQDSDGPPVSAPVVSYKSADGKTHRFESSSGSHPPRYREGDAVQVVYLRGSEQEAQILSFTALWVLPILTAVLASAMFAVAALSFVVWLERR